MEYCDKHYDVSTAIYLPSFDYINGITGVVRNTVIETKLLYLIEDGLLNPDVNYYAIHFAPILVSLLVIKPAVSVNGFCSYYNSFIKGHRTYSLWNNS